MEGPSVPLGFELRHSLSTSRKKLRCKDHTEEIEGVSDDFAQQDVFTVAVSPGAMRDTNAVEMEILANDETLWHAPCSNDDSAGC